MTTIDYTSARLASNDGDACWYANEENARAARRMYIDNGHAVSLIAGQTLNGADGYSFDVFDLWTEREAFGLDDPTADERLHRNDPAMREAVPVNDWNTHRIEQGLEPLSAARLAAIGERLTNRPDPIPLTTDLRAEYEAPESDPADQDPAEAEPTTGTNIRATSGTKLRGIILTRIPGINDDPDLYSVYWENGTTTLTNTGFELDVCPVHGPDCEAWT